MMKAVFMTEFFSDNIVNVDFWYTSSDDTSLDFIHGIAQHIEKLADIINWEPRFVTWSCSTCPDDYKQENCLSDGKYCSMRKSKNLKISGSELLHEDLRQYCLYSLTKDFKLDSMIDDESNLFGFSIKQLLEKKALPPQALYFEYLKRAHELFKDRITEEDSMKIMENWGINIDKVR